MGSSSHHSRHENYRRMQKASNCKERMLLDWDQSFGVVLRISPKPLLFIIVLLAERLVWKMNIPWQCCSKLGAALFRADSAAALVGLESRKHIKLYPVPGTIHHPTADDAGT
jgi:hypothetical protein